MLVLSLRIVLEAECSIWEVDQVKAKHLDGLTINLASGGLGQALGGFTAKKSEYSLYPAALLKTGLHEEDEKPDEPRGGDEMTSLVALLPRKSSGDKLEQGLPPFSHGGDFID